MYTTYKNRNIPSPYQVLEKQEFDVRNNKNPIIVEMEKNIGSYTFTAVFERDIQTLEIFKNVKGLIAFVCTLVGKNNEIIGQGRGTSVISSKINKYVEKTIRYAFNSALLDAVAKATKSLDTLKIEATDQKDDAEPIEEIFPIEEEHNQKVSDTGMELPETFNEKPATQGITLKQRDYLKQLVATNVKSELERDRWESEIDNLSRNEASQAIQSFKK
jgi:hypothetical protein